MNTNFILTKKMTKYTKIAWLLIFISSASHADGEVKSYTGIYHGTGHNFPARLELKSDNTYFWSFYKDGEFQSKGKWSLEANNIVLHAQSLEKPIKLEKRPSGLIPYELRDIRVCLNFPGSVYESLNNKPTRVEISLKDRNNRLISNVEKIETLHQSYGCARFNIQNENEKNDRAKLKNQINPYLRDIKYVAIRETDTDTWQEYTVTENDKISSKISFKSLDASTLPSPFKTINIEIKNDKLILNSADIGGEYEKVADEKFSPKINGLYRNEWGSIKYLPDNTYEWHWKKTCCMKEFTIKGKWREEAGFIIMEEQDPDVYNGGFRFITKAELAKRKINTQKLLDQDDLRYDLYTIFIGKFGVNRHGEQNLETTGSWEIQILDKKSKIIDSVVNDTFPVRILRTKNRPWSIIKIRQLNQNAQWYYLTIPKHMRRDTTIHITPLEAIPPLATNFKRIVVQIKPNDSITLKSPIYYWGYLNYK